VNGLILSATRGAVRRITFNRPEKHNAFTPEMEAELHAAIGAALADPAVRVIVLAGAGRSFSSGADVGVGTATISDAPADMVRNRARVEGWLGLWSAPKPLIAQVHGWCLGTANELAGCCDLVVCGESARLGMPEVRRFALPPTLGFWPARIGLQRTKELLFTGRHVSGAEAVGLGLAIACVPDAELEAHVDALAAQIAEVPSARLAVVKQAANAWLECAGVRTAALRGADYHAIYHQASEWEKLERPKPVRPLAGSAPDDA
jgi:enoyl-CoA hydratase